MHRFPFQVSLGALVLLSLSWLSVPEQPGALIIVGGGGTPPAVVSRAIELAGGEESVVVVLPHASSREDRGVGSVEMFREAGAGEALLIDDLASPSAQSKLQRATLIWMPGGSQNKLMSAIDEASLNELLIELHASGVAFGGTSAGAAVQSGLMITGEAELEAVVAKGTKLGRGLDLWSQVIVDQHAHRRRRFNRLLSAVLDHPSKVGMAIDEKTAIIVQGRKFEVLGSSSVLVLDARDAEVEETKAGAPHGARNLAMHLLREGMGFSLD